MFKLFNLIPSVTTNELHQELNSSITLIDVRTEKEYNKGYIFGSKNIPLDEINTFSGDKSEKVYLVCKSGVRSKKAAKELKEKGYSVVNVSGGMSNWTGPVMVKKGVK